MDIKLIFDSALVIGEYSLLFVLVIITSLKCWTRAFYWRMDLLVCNFKRIVALISVRCSNKTSLLRNELIIIRLLVLSLNSSKSLHSCFKSIHSSGHCADKFRLRVINENIEFISFFLVIVSLLYDFIIVDWWRLFPWFSLSWHVSFVVTIIYPLLVLKVLHI